MTIVTLDNNRIILLNNDCNEGLKRIKDNYIDITVTSPPYDDLRLYDGFTLDIPRLITNLYRVTKVGGVVVWVVNDMTKNGSESGNSFRQALMFMEVGFKLHDTMIYEKDMFGNPSNNRYHQIFEYMFVFSKGVPKTVNRLKDRKNKWHGQTVRGRYRLTNGEFSEKYNAGKEIDEFGYRTNIWRYGNGKFKTTKDEIAFNHPAIFPEQLVHDHILSWSNPNDIVLDPMMGSGTSGKMAIKLNRRFIGIEISKNYFYNIAIPRIQRTITTVNDTF